MVLVFIIIFIQKRPAGHLRDEGPARRSMSGPPEIASPPQRRIRPCWRAARPGWRRAGSPLLRTCCVLAPVLNLVVPEGSAFHLSDYAVALVGKILCYAICALAMDLIWGYTGILSLGHGLFFALGGYAMGMYLMRQIGRDGQYQEPTCRTSWCS